MTPEEYRRVIAALDLNQEGAAELLGVNARTSRKWANGERKIPPPARRFLLFLEAARISPSQVFEAIGYRGNAHLKSAHQRSALPVKTAS